jgi:hypothetical protein
LITKSTLLALVVSTVNRKGPTPLHSSVAMEYAIADGWKWRKLTPDVFEKDIRQVLRPIILWLEELQEVVEEEEGIRPIKFHKQHRSAGAVGGGNRGDGGNCGPINHGSASLYSCQYDDTFFDGRQSIEILLQEISRRPRSHRKKGGDTPARSSSTSRTTRALDSIQALEDYVK